MVKRLNKCSTMIRGNRRSVSLSQFNLNYPLLPSRVVYFSIHRYEHGEFWPNLRESDFDYVGDDAGEGYNFNVPLNKTGMTNADYLAIFQQLLLPMAYEVNIFFFSNRLCSNEMLQLNDFSFNLILL